MIRAQKQSKDGRGLSEFVLEMKTAGDERIDITEIATELVIYEDIATPYITGYVRIMDNMGYYDNIPLCGEEEIYLKFTSIIDIFDNIKELTGDTDDEKFDISPYVKAFETTKITDIRYINVKTRAYTIHFASKGYKRNSAMRISKSYTNMRSSDIMKDIITNDLYMAVNGKNKIPENRNDVKIVPTKYLDNIVFPFITPYEAGEWLASRSIGNYGNSKGETTAANYVFYENKIGLRFVPIEALSLATSNLLFNVWNMTENGTESVMPGNIKRISATGKFDFQRQVQNGMYASKVIGYNILTGEYDSLNYDYLQDFNKIDYINNANSNNNPIVKVDENNKNIYTENADACLKVVPYYRNAFGAERKDGGEYANPFQYIQQRMSYMEVLNSQKLHVEVYGFSGFTVGKMIYLDYKLPTLDNAYDKLADSRYYRGRYLITAISHVITNDSYMNFAEITKDAFFPGILKKEV